MSVVPVQLVLRRISFLVVSGLCLSSSVQAQTTAVSHPAPMIHSATDESVRLTLKDGLRPETAQQVDLGKLDAGVKLDKMVLLLKRSPAAQAAFDQLTIDQQDPHSPMFHHWLTPNQIGQQFGAAPEDTAQITAWLTAHGFQVDSVARGGLMLLFSGTEGQLESAFQTSMHTFRNAAGETHVANIQEPSIPAALEPAIAGIAALNNYPLKPLSHLYGTAHLDRSGSTAAGSSPAQWQVTKGIPAAFAPTTSAVPSTARPQFSTSVGSYHFTLVSPYDFATIYNVTPLWNSGIDGTGQTIALLAESDINPQDVASFRSTFGLPANPVNIVYVGPNPGKGPSEVEAALDAEWSGAVAKNATIDVVVAQSTLTSDGLVLGAYDVIDNNLASVLSVSWGECEYGLGNAGNQLFSALWQQAAAQGITVAVASGDAGSAACDQGTSTAARLGATVNGFASTPYNIAVGGTDLYGSYTNASGSWSATNNPTTLASALGYIQEISWNDSCGNPEYLAAALKAGQVSAADINTEKFCNDRTYFTSGPVVAGGGGGGLSGCITSNGISESTCSAGYPQPAWQSSVAKLTSRAVPDVSLFAGDGLWATAYVLCQSDATPDGVCNDASSTDLEYLVAGGTSFGTPAFAGIMALIDQKTGSRQGNAAPTLYQLYSAQAKSALPCDASVATAGSNCVFQDISTGSIAEPCFSATLNCTALVSGDRYAVQSGWNDAVGFDPASGLGSVNAANLANSWASVSGSFAATTTTFSVNQTSLTYGVADASTVTVAASSGTPTGSVSAVTSGFGGGPYPLGTSGTATFSLLGLSAGAHAVTAHYGGDGTFAASDSAPVNLTVSQASTSLSLKPSLTALTTGQSLSLSSTVATTSKANSPTGSVAFTNTSTGSVLATAVLTPATDSQGNSIAVAQATVPSQVLQNGSNAIVASYVGDTNYLASSAPAVAVIYTGPFVLSMVNSMLTIPAQGSASATVTVTSSSATLPQAVFLACPQTLPTGLSCAFSPAVLPAGSKSATSTLTVYASSALVRNVAPSGPGRRRASSEALAGVSLAGLLLLLAGSRRATRRKFRTLRLLALPLLLLCAGIGLTLSGCSSSSSTSTPAVQLAVSSSTPSAGTPVTFTATVTDPKGASVGQGPISFIENGSLLGTGTLNAQGVATFSTSKLSIGSHSVSASYPGVGKELAATSAPIATDVTFTTPVLLSATDSTGNSSNVTLSVMVK